MACLQLWGCPLLTVVVMRIGHDGEVSSLKSASPNNVWQLMLAQHTSLKAPAQHQPRGGEEGGGGGVRCGCNGAPRRLPPPSPASTTRSCPSRRGCRVKLVGGDLVVLGTLGDFLIAILKLLKNAGISNI